MTATSDHAEKMKERSMHAADSAAHAMFAQREVEIAATVRLESLAAEAKAVDWHSLARKAGSQGQYCYGAECQNSTEANELVPDVDVNAI